MTAALTNRYSQQVADAREKWQRDRDAESSAGVRSAANEAAFASLRPAKAASPASLEFLAHAATRRLDRWCDPATGGLDPKDKADLLRQAEVMDVPAAEAERVFAGVEEAYRNRPKPTAAPQAEVRRRFALPRPRSMLAWLGLALCAGVTIAIMAWLWMGVLSAGE